MRRVILSATGLLIFILLAMTSGTPTEAAAPSNLLFSQSCASDSTVTVNIGWRSDPAAREIWVDYNSAGGNFDSLAFSSDGPLSGRATSEQVRGLTPHKDYWFRVNQLLPSGDWEASAPVRYALGCGNVPAPAGSIQVTGFGDGNLRVAPNANLKSCNPSRLWVYLSLSGLTEITDVSFVWFQGNQEIVRTTTAFDSSMSSFAASIGKSSGAPEGPYGVQVWTGGDGTWRLSASGRFTLDC